MDWRPARTRMAFRRERKRIIERAKLRQESEWSLESHALVPFVKRRPTNRPSKPKTEYSAEPGFAAPLRRQSRRPPGLVSSAAAKAPPTRRDRRCRTNTVSQARHRNRGHGSAAANRECLRGVPG